MDRELISFGRAALCLVAAVYPAACSDGTARAPVGPPEERVEARVEPELLALLDAGSGPVDVIVNFRDTMPAHAAREARRIEYHALQNRLLESQRDFVLSRRFEHVPALAGQLTRAALERLRRDPNVAYIQLDSRGGGALKEAVPAIGADMVKSSYGLTGKGVRVAVLDTGVDTTHPDLKDAIVGQHCFTQGDCQPLFQREGTTAEDDHGHGSNVAGIIASRGVVAGPGFAPASEIVAVKVDDANDSGQESDWVAGLDWVYDNLAMLKVQVINMSICTIRLFPDAASCDAGEPALARAVKNLTDAGVVIFAASGNNGSTSMTSAPACNTGVIAVGAVYDSNVGAQPPGAATYAARWGATGFANCGDATTAFDQVTCFTNSNARLDLLAPGAPITSDTLNGQTETYWGTSQASPVAAGVAALMLECRPQLTPERIKEAMVMTGVPRPDPKNGMTFPSLRAMPAVTEACYADGVAGMGAGMGVAGMGGAAGAAGVGSAGSGAGGTGASMLPTGSAGTGSAGAAGAAPAMNGAGLPGGAGASANVNGEAGQAGVPAQTPPIANGVAGAGTPDATLPAATSQPGGRGAGASASCGCSVPGTRPLAWTPLAGWALFGGVLVRWRRSRKSARRMGE